MEHLKFKCFNNVSVQLATVNDTCEGEILIKDKYVTDPRFISFYMKAGYDPFWPENVADRKEETVLRRVLRRCC